MHQETLESHKQSPLSYFLLLPAQGKKSSCRRSSHCYAGCFSLPFAFVACHLALRASFQHLNKAWARSSLIRVTSYACGHLARSEIVYVGLKREVELTSASRPAFLSAARGLMCSLTISSLSISSLHHAMQPNHTLPEMRSVLLSA